MDEFYTSPPLLNILCMFLGASIFFSPHLWLLTKLKAQSAYAEPLGLFAFKTAMATFFAVTLLSFFNGFSKTAEILWPEFILLCALTGGAFLYSRIQKYSVPAFFKKTSAFIASTVLKILSFMAISVLLTTALMFAFINLNTALSAPVFLPVREATFLMSVLWIALLYKLHIRVETKDKNKFHHLLWPLVLGLLILMLPMLLQSLITSEKFQDSLNRTPPLQKV